MSRQAFAMSNAIETRMTAMTCSGTRASATMARADSPDSVGVALCTSIPVERRRGSTKRCTSIYGSFVGETFSEPCVNPEPYKTAVRFGCRNRALMHVGASHDVLRRVAFDKQLRRLLMKANAYWVVALAGLALAACNKTESPAEVQHDVTTAQAEGQKDVADAQSDARKDVADQQEDLAKAAQDNDSNDVADQSKDVNKAEAKGEYKVAVAQAEATHKVAVEKCEALKGTAQKDCKDRADSDLDRA